MSAATFARAYRLPHGYVAEFRIALDQIKPGEVNPRGITCEWSPHVPQIRSPRAQRKFLRAYTAARDDFFQDLAQLIGGNVLNIDSDERLRPIGAKIFKATGDPMSAPDFVTIARAHDPQVVMAKVVHLGKYGIVDVEPSPHAFLWSFEQVAVDGLDSLAQAIRTAAADPYAIAVRAAPVMPIGRRAVYAEPEYGKHAEPGLRAVPRRWAAFDFDNVEDANTVEDDPAEQANWDRPPALFMPEVGAEIARKRLPPEFRNVQCLIQVTGSAGFKPGYRLRLWYWIDHPTTGEELQIWCKPAIERNLVDRVTLREAQEHYVAVRVIGGRDPCPARFLFLPGEADTVKVPDIASIKRRQDEAERKERQRRQAKQPKAGTKITAPKLAQRRLADCIAKLKDARDGEKHLVYVDQCAAAKYICDEFELDCWPQVRRDLAATYESILPAGEADRRRRGSIEGVPNWIERRAG